MHGTRPPSEQQICADTWRDKYRYGDEASYDAMCERVIHALCKNEPSSFAAEALRAMQARQIVPAGRILAGAGAGKRVTLINCYTSPLIQDSMATEHDRPGKGIMDSLAVAAYSLQMGGGIGMDFSTIRPRGATVKRTASVSSGVLPFMDMWNAMSETIMSAGHRRGAMMATLRCDHPDIEEFIEAKQQPDRLTNFNVSVLVTDEFMRAVERDASWKLKFTTYDAAGSPEEGLHKIVSARALWDKITAATYVHAEPGVIFIDRVNALNNLGYCEHIHACNPCGEQMLPDSGACNLGHINLAVMVDRPFTPDAAVNLTAISDAARTLTRLLDNVLDVTLWPTEAQAREGAAKRRIGVGFTGLATALQQLGVPYGSPRAVDVARSIARLIAVSVYSESISLAKTRGPFLMFDADKFCEAPFVRKLDESIGGGVIQSIKKHGIRNGVLLSVAPTGTTSLVVGNVSSGIEPVFAHRVRRKVRAAAGATDTEYSVYDYGYLKYCEMLELDPESVDESRLPEVWPGFVTAGTLDVEQHLQMAAAVQGWVDSAISKTINCPESMSIEEFREVYARAYALGLKGCTTYRPDPQSGRGAVLVAEGNMRKEVMEGGESQESQGQEGQEGQAREVARRAPRDDDKIPMQDVVDARRYRIKWPTEDCSYYVVITDYTDGAGRRRPFELFISTKSERHSEWVKAFSLLVTAIFRREGDPSFVVDELRSVFSAAGGAWVRVPWDGKSKLAPSLVAAIGLKIEEHLRWLGLVREEARASSDDNSVMPAAELLDVCDACGARAVIYSEGCATCHACGRSDCG